MVLPLPKAELIGTLLETAGFGAYLIVFVECLQVLHARRRAGRNMCFLAATATVIFVLITAHMLIDFVRAIDAFTYSMSVPNSATQFYEAINTPLSLAKTATYVTVTLVLDALIVYRTYVVWGRSLAVVFLPSTLFVADIALSAWATWSITEVHIEADIMFENVTLRVKYFYAVTLALNLFCTLAIAGRIWSVHRSVADHMVSGVRFTGVIAVVLESAAIYSVLLLILIITSTLGSPAMFIVLNAISPIIGIVFSAVIVRASRESQAEACLPTHMSFISAPSSPLPRGSSPCFTDPFTHAPERRASKRSAGRTRRDSDYTMCASLRSKRLSRLSHLSHLSTPPWALRPLEPLAPTHPPSERVRHSEEMREPSRPLSRAVSCMELHVPTPAEGVHICVEVHVDGGEEIELEDLEAGQGGEVSQT